MAIIQARSEDDVIDAVSAARDRRSPLEIRGRGTKRDFGRPVETDDVLDVSGLSGIVMYEPDELVITAKAGTAVAEIEDIIAGKRQRLGFDPADWGPLFGVGSGCATIGGVLSANACGSARVRFGAARDHLLGFRAVNGFAESYKAGGRVVKNVTGFDVPKLMCGAIGTLGVLTEVTLRLMPRAEFAVTLVARDLAPQAGLDLLRSTWTSAFGPTGLAYVPASVVPRFSCLDDVGAGAALIRVEGARIPLDEKIAGIRALARGISFDPVDGGSVFDTIGSGGVFVGPSCDIWRVAVPPGSAARCMADIGADTWLADWSGGMVWIATPPDDDATALRIRTAAATCSGHATLLRACAPMRQRTGVFQPQTPELMTLSHAVKAALDPLKLFSPGRMFEGL